MYCIGVILVKYSTLPNVHIHSFNSGTLMRMSHREEVVGCWTYRMSQEERAISALLPLSLRWCARHQHLGRLNTTHVATLFSAAFIFGSAFYHGNTLTCNWILCRLPTSITVIELLHAVVCVPVHTSPFLYRFLHKSTFYLGTFRIWNCVTITTV